MRLIINIADQPRSDSSRKREGAVSLNIQISRTHSGVITGKGVENPQNPQIAFCKCKLPGPNFWDHPTRGPQTKNHFADQIDAFWKRFGTDSGFSYQNVQQNGVHQLQDPLVPGSVPGSTSLLGAPPPLGGVCFHIADDSEADVLF